MDIPDDLISLAEAAKLLPSRKPGRRLHVASLYRWCRTGQLQGWRIGNHWFVSRREILRMPRPAAVQVEVATANERRREFEAAMGRLRAAGCV